MSQRRVVVVVPSFNDRPTIRACIDSLRDTAGHPDWELVVVDGGSTDGSLEILERYRDAGLLRLVRDERRGVAASLNAAFAAAGRADVARVHADVVMETKGWLAILADAARTADKAGVVGCKLVYPDDRIHSVGRNFITGIGLVERHANLQRFNPDDDRPGKPIEVDSVPGSVSYVTREALDATGGLDEGYWPVYFDDDDFCFSARRHGFKVYAHSGVKAVHYSSSWKPTTWHAVRDHENLVVRVSPFRDAVMNSHAERFAKKWGFDPRFPDLAEVRRLYGKTEVAWRVGEPMRFEPKSWPPSVDVVMVTWNNKSMLERCLETLAATRYPAKSLAVHVTDNGSTDGTVEFLRGLAKTFPFPLHVHELPVNTGVAIGFNWAIVRGEGELVARLDDDVLLPPDWLEKLAQGFRTRPFAGCVGPKILNHNGNADIQCGPYRMYPGIFGHDREADRGQADYLSRCIHVRGCCNLYRRDVLKKVGLFDLRFSPSQYDDPDHHAALAVHGYEILYDGRVGVVHALNSGAGQTFAAIANKNANQEKLYGKWGPEIWMILDRSLDESVEGRFLPDDGDISGYLATLPPPDAFPRENVPVSTESTRERIEKILRMRDWVLLADGPHREYWDDFLAHGVALRRDGFLQESASSFVSMIDLAPAGVTAMTELATTYEAMGEWSRAALMLRRAAALTPDDGEIRARLDRLTEKTLLGAATAAENERVAPADRSRDIGEAVLATVRPQSKPKLRVLMVNTFERRTAGGDMHQVKKTKQAIEALGATVDVAYEPRPNPRGYDLVHVWNLWFPAQTLPQVRGLRVAAPDVPIVLSPIYWDMSEKAWADGAIPAIFAHSTSETELNEKLRHLASGVLSVNERRRTDRQEPNFAGYETYQRRILGLVDHLLPNSEAEMRNMEATLGVRPPYTVVRNAADPTVFDAATKEWFEREYGVKDFVLTVGLVETRKNQLMLLRALADLTIPVVVIGRNYNRHYLRLCRRFAGQKHKTIFIEHLPHEMLASALKAARVFALPSWMECASFAIVEAALAGCPLVVSNRTSEPEYFGNDAYTCDPADVESIRHAVVRAYENRDADEGKRARLQDLFRNRYTWENAGRSTLEGYRRAFEARGLVFPGDAPSPNAQGGLFPAHA